MKSNPLNLSQLKSLVMKIKTRKYIGITFQIDIDNPNLFFDIVILSSLKTINDPENSNYKIIYADEKMNSVQIFESFVENIVEDKCLYIVYDFGFVMQDYKIEKGGFSMLDYIPDSASIKSKAPYSYNSLELKKELDIGHKTTINDKRDMNCQYIIDKLYRIVID